MASIGDFPTGVVTFLLTDVEGSTKLWEAHPHEMSEAMAWHDKMVETAATSHQGFVLKARGEGDSQFIVFANPSGAVETAVDIQRALVDEKPRLAFPLRIRAGLHTGAAEWRDGDYYGAVVNRCARIRSLGHGGQTLLSEVTANLVQDTLPDGIALLDKGMHRLKGLTRPEKVFQLSIPELSDEFPPLKSSLDFTFSLPSSPTPLFGRNRETNDITNLLALDSVRLLTLVGPGGVGKTRLALEVASDLQDHFRNGVCFVDLAPLVHPDHIMGAIAGAIDFHAPNKGLELQPQLLATLAQRDLLLILDNFEHLIAGAHLVHDILQACPEVTVLVTSRQRLNLASETLYRVGGLDFPSELQSPDGRPYSAIQLFVASGRRVLPGFELTAANVADVIRICRLVQGMPLGLVLAATWLALLTPEEIASEIDRSLEFLAAELSDLHPRQRSMHAVFEGSWQLMQPEEQVVLARLSVFRGGFTRHAAEKVAGANLPILLSLVNRSLLQRQSDSDRYTVHELLRQYAASECLAVDPEHQTELVHCQYFAELVAREIRRAVYFYPFGITQQYSADRDNFVRAWSYALEHGLPDELTDLTRALALFSIRQGIQSPTLIDQALNSLERQGHSADSTAMLNIRLTALAMRGGFDDIHVLENEFINLLEAVERNDDPELRFWTYERLCGVYGDLQDSRAIDLAHQAERVAREMGDDLLVRMSEATGLWLKVDLGISKDEETTSRLKAALPYFAQQCPDSFITYALLFALSDASHSQGKFELALDYGQQALTIAKQWQDLFWISYVARVLTRTYLDLGLTEKARLSHLEVLDWHLAIGQRWQTLGFLMSNVATQPELIGGWEVATAILSMVYHHPESVPHFRQTIDEGLKQQMATSLGSEAFIAAWEAGKTLDFETATDQLRLALGSGLENRTGSPTEPSP